ncbi:GAF and ANTAR domain-containing protein [uncultured Williamsia sp.]|uniref:GAF and ANTAR domain-containing protein n=1 Tax=uncultured Williamsia sp. TaxID=259311 RepID=UPI002624CCC0|nr:GAF and ANTAR domain-containing protein [uncultured Williamsia sp.]
MAELVREMHAIPETAPDALDRVLTAVTSGALANVPGTDHAGVLLVDASQRELTSVATTDDIMSTLDALQQDTGEGPCLAAAAGATAGDDTLVWVDDISSDPRWPRLSARIVAETPARSSVSFRLFTHQGTLGALNLFSDTVNAFDEDSREIGRVYATHAALAMFRTRQQGEFRSALASRDAIGQAKGMVMERFGVDAVEAFALLRRLSQNGNLPLADVAWRLVDAGSESAGGDARGRQATR